MKSWLHSRGLRKMKSEAFLRPFERCSSTDRDEVLPPRPAEDLGGFEMSMRRATSKTSSRMSIERYLSAPLADEPASVPAITAALQRQTSQIGELPKLQSFHKRGLSGYSRGSSIDANSEGRRTFYTSGSAPESTGTSYSALSKTHRRQRSNTHAGTPELPSIDTFVPMPNRTASPERPTTSATEYMEMTWAEQIEKFMPGYERDTKTDFRAKAEQEIARIQEKARQLEEELKKYQAELDAVKNQPPRVTDEQAYAQMAQRPKLAWILGGDMSDAKSIERPKSRGSVLSNATDYTERPSTERPSMERPSSRATVKETPQQWPRRNQSIGALEEFHRELAEKKRPVTLTEAHPTKRPRFYCTFCQKRFHSRVEWTRHEQTIHMPEELWVCCPRTGEFPQRCPFCAKTNPSPSHLADHNYMSCQEKPLSERTFSRQDHFLQHISQVHRVSPEQKPVRFTELVDAWKHPLPLKSGHQALHCGFCGQTFKTYAERTQHVGNHYMEGAEMMSWWSARVSHDINLTESEEGIHRNADLPHKCRYCERMYPNLTIAMKTHPYCTMWSCSFLPGMQYSIYPSGTRTNLEALCCYCNVTLVKGAGKVKGSVLKEHINQHNFRNCNQRLYFSAQRFRQHLQDSHKTNYDGTLMAGWMLLMKSSKKDKRSVFEAVDPVAVRRANTDPTLEAAKRQEAVEPMPHFSKMNFMDLSETPGRESIGSRRRLRRKESTQSVPEKAALLSPEMRESGHFFTRSSTIDLAYGQKASPSPRMALGGLLSPKNKVHQHKAGYPISSLPTDAINTCPRFYRRRLDGSTRNRVYIREQDESLLSKNSQRLFRKLPGSAFGGLVLHSSLVGTTPARMTNSIDIYPLH